jgi:hypothetical protein
LWEESVQVYLAEDKEVISNTSIKVPVIQFAFNQNTQPDLSNPIDQTVG